MTSETVSSNKTEKPQNQNEDAFPALIERCSGKSLSAAPGPVFRWETH